MGPRIEPGFMGVRPHLSQHDAAKGLPLVTESATVTAVETMDRSRDDAVLRAIRETLDRSGSASWEDDLPYREHFRSLARERDDFHFVPTLSRERYLSDWDGETDCVQHVLVKYLVEAVERFGVPDRHTQFEGFG